MAFADAYVDILAASQTGNLGIADGFPYLAHPAGKLGSTSLSLPSGTAGANKTSEPMAENEASR